MSGKLVKAVVAAIALLMSMPGSGHSETIFSDGFDASPDWQSAERFSPASNAAWPRTWAGNPNGATQPPPKNWTSYRAAVPKRDGHEKTYVLGAEGSRNPGGKGMTYNIESTAYGTWVGGGLDVYLGDAGHKEMFVRFYLKYDPDTFHWGSAAPAFGKQKLARISRLKVPPSTAINAQLWDTGGYQMPTFFPDLMNNPTYNTPSKTPPSYGVHLNYSHRYDPTYFVNDGNNDVNVWTVPWASAGTADPAASWFEPDGKWHCYEYRLKMNSAPGVADGEWEIWIDGGTTPDRHFLKKGIPWVLEGGSVDPGWNWVTVLDNATIQPDIAYADTVMKLFMDDLVISTHYSGPPPAPVSVSAQALSSASARVEWAAGTSTVPARIDGYRVYYGLDPDNPTGIYDAGTATSADIPNLQAGETYHFAVAAYHREDGETTDNESLKSEVVAVAPSAQSAPAADSVPPTVSISSPVSGSTVSGTANVTLAATDSVGVSRTELYINGALYAVVGSAPHSVAWNTGSYTDGSYQLSAKAYDAAGNVGQSSVATVNVRNAVTADAIAVATAGPVVEVISPAANEAVPSMTKISASASSSLGMLQMRVYVDNVLKASVSASSISYNWDTSAYAKGSHAIMIYAFDKAKNLSIAKFNVITGASDTTAPTVTTFALPASASQLSVPVFLTAFDSVAVTGYLVSESAIPPAASASGWTAAAPAAFTFAGEGARTAYAWAKDAAGNVSATAKADVVIELPDVTVPVASIGSPADGATLTGLARVSAVASDNKGVGKVEFFIDGALKATVSAAPYAFSWNTEEAANGSHALTVKAYDMAGNVGHSSAVHVEVFNDAAAPVIGSFAMPATATSLTVPVSLLSATDNVGVTGYLITESASAPAASSSSWSASAPTGFTFAGEGLRTAYAWAKDAKGNVSAGAVATVNVAIPDTAPPVITVVSPAADATVSMKVAISATASDKSGILQMRVYIDKVLMAITNKDSLSYTWDTSKYAAGDHSIVIYAFDKLKNLAITTIDVTK